MGAVIDNGIQIHNGVAAKNAVFDGFTEPFFNSRQVSGRYDAADNFTGKRKARISFRRFDPYPDIAVLSSAPGLFFILSLRLCRYADRFAVGDFNR